MKKILFLLLILIPLYTNAGLFGSKSSFNLYEKIDKGIHQYELKMLQKEINGGDPNNSIVDVLNKLAKDNSLEECFEKEISIENFEKIVKSEQINLITDSFKEKEECNEMNFDTLNKYYGLVRGHYSISYQKSTETVKTLYEISRIGLFSDGDLNNSPFDLMHDLDQINKVLFEEEYEYEGVNTFDINKGMNKFIKGEKVENGNDDVLLPPLLPSSPGAGPGGGAPSVGGGSGGGGTPGVIPNFDFGSITNPTNILCQTGSSGLDNNYIDGLLISSGINIFNTGSSSTTTGTTGSTTGTTSTTTGSTTGTATGTTSTNPININYSSINDDTEWPCNDFFCLKIDFIMYTQKLLGGFKSRAIETFIKKANEDFKKGAHSSLVQPKMTTNNFELGLNNVNLADMFHMGIEITKKAPPILNLSSNNIEQEGNLSSTTKKLLKKYFESAGMNYDRQNDIGILEKDEDNFQIIENSQELTFSILNERLKETNQEKIEPQLESKALDLSLNVNYINENLKDFSKQLLEFQTLFSFIKNYSNEIKEIVQLINGLPKN